MKKGKSLSELKKDLQTLTKKYGLKATLEQQQEVIALGKKIEELEQKEKS